MVARSGSNISVACGGVSSSSYIYLIEWVCQGCDCGQCPSHSNNGLRLLRYNDKITQWDNSYRYGHYYISHGINDSVTRMMITIV